jgi:uncharacterized glyoxalase superfamily protein PhnB
VTHPGVWPTLRANDAPELLRFLTEVVGFEATLVIPSDEGIAHAELVWPEGGGLMLGSARPAGDDHWPVAPGSGAIYLSTQDVEGLAERLSCAGVSLSGPPTTTDYGSQQLEFRDPEGNLWSAGTYRGA